MTRRIWTLNLLTLVFLLIGQSVAQTAPAASAAPGNDYSFNVSTTQPWTDTGVDLQTGDVLEITAASSQGCDPLGVSGASAPNLLVANALPGALIAKIQPQGIPVLIGSIKEVKVDAPGH